MEKRRDKPPKTCRGNKIKARESEAESAMYWWGKSKSAKGKCYRHKPRGEHADTKRETEREGEGESTISL